jgi:muramidase (phage lysozyme)
MSIRSIDNTWATINFIDTADITKKVTFNVASVATGTTHTVYWPNSDIYPVDLTLAQTLTNKTINASSNTILNLADANIISTAGINATKLGNGDVTNTQLSYLNSLTSNVQTQINNITAGTVSITHAQVTDWTSAVNSVISTQAGAANGLATLNSSGKVPASQLSINSITYQGTWNATTNTPTLTSSVGTQGYYYVVSTAGTTSLNGYNNWNVGDWAIFNSSTWEQISSQGTVTSVNGQQGAVTLTASSITSGTFANAQISSSSVTQWTSSININNLSGAPAGTVLGTTDSQTLTNKSLIMQSNAFVDNGDNTKKIAFSQTSASTATTLTFSSQQTTSQTLLVPNITASDTIVTLGLNQTITGSKTFSGGIFLGSSTYNTGTASQSSNTITGTSTAFTNAMIGGVIVFANGVQAFITAYTSTTSLTVSQSQTVANQNYIIYYGGHQNDNAGNQAIKNMNVSGLTASYPVQTDSNKNLISAAISLTAAVSGILPVTNGGTGLATIPSGYFVTGNGSSTVTTSVAVPGSATVVGLSDTQTLSNKTLLTSDVFADTTDSSKRLVFNLASATTGTTLTFVSNQTTSQSLSIPNVGSGDIVMTTSTTQTVSGAKTFNSVTGFFAGSTTYNTGTISQSTTTIIGSGTTFTSSMIGGVIVFANGTQALVTGYTSATSLTVKQSQTVSSQGYVLYYGGVQIDSLGDFTANNININNATLPNLTASLPVQTDANKNLISAAISLTSGSTQITGVLSVPNGGTGNTSNPTGFFLTGNGTSAVITTKAVPAGVVVGTTDSQILSNKTLLTSDVFADTSDNTKQFILNLASATTSTTLTFVSNQTTSQSLSIPNIGASDNMMTTGTTQTVTGTKTFTSINTLFSGTSNYNVGTASQSTTVITGSGTTFTSGMVGGVIIFSNGIQAFITGYTSATSLTVKQSQTVSSQGYVLYYGGMQVDNLGNATHTNMNISGLSASLPVQTDANKNLISSAISLSSTQVTNILGVANGGTGLATIPSGYFVTGNGTSAVITTIAVPGSGVIIGTTDSQTLSNKTFLTSDAFADTTDSTKRLLFNLASATTGTTLTFVSNQTTSQSLSIPNIGSSDTIMTSGTTQTITGTKAFNNVTNLFAGSTVYSTGTISQSTTTITGSGTTFTSSMVGGVIIFANGVQALVTAFTSTTSLTVKQSQTVSSQAYNLYYGGVQIDNLGDLTANNINITNVTLPNLSVSLPVQTDANKNLISAAISLTSGSTQITGVLSVANGGTGSNTLTSGNFLVGAGTSAVTTTKAAPAGVVVGTTDSQVLTNKSLVNASCFHVDATDNTKQVGFQSSGATTSTTLTLASIQTTSQTLSIPNVGAGDTILTANSSKLLANATGLMVSNTIYNTGTASQSGYTITGSGTTFTSSMIGGVIVFANGAQAFITAYTSATSLTARQSQTVSSLQAYNLYYGGMQVDNLGNTTHINMQITGLTASLPVQTDANKNLISAAISLASASTQITGVLSVPNGGTGLTTMPSGYFLTGNGTSNVSTTIAVPGSGIIVGTTDTQTLQNKTIQASPSGNNTITGITDSSIASGANINVAKLGTGAVTNTTFNYIQNVTSDVQTQLNNHQAFLPTVATYTTTNATAITIVTISTSANTTYMVTSNFAARRTDAGTESAGYVCYSTYRNNSGVLTLIASDILGMEDPPKAWVGAPGVSGTTIILTVQGATSKTINWIVQYTVMTV